MYRLQVERRISAVHAIEIAGALETPHEHVWRVRVQVAGAALDADGLLFDFHALEAKLDAVLEPFHGADLNVTPPFNACNPTAEHVARHVASAMAVDLPPGITSVEAAVTEAPGCEAFCTVEVHTGALS